MKSLHFVEKRRSCLWGVHWLCIFELKLGQYCHSTNSRESSEEEDGIGAPTLFKFKAFYQEMSVLWLLQHKAQLLQIPYWA